MTITWDPAQYLKFEAERARAFHDLVARLAHRRPATVVDLGCGPGRLTATLRQRWPDARITGVDSSAEMIEAAAALAEPGRLDFQRMSIEDWTPPEPVDLIISNAALQWVPSHVDLLRTWLDRALAPGGAIAFQVPRGGDAPAAAAIREVARTPRWAGRFTTVAVARGPSGGDSPVLTPESYLEQLARPAIAIDVWETTYLHVLPGENPVLEWYAGTGLRPYLDALEGDPGARESFRVEVAAALRAVYPLRPYGTVLPFRRIFVVAERAS